MTLTNPTALVTAVKNSLDACAVWVSESGSVWYPKAPAGTAPPFAVIAPGGTTVSRVAAGSIGIPAGSVDVEFTFDAASKTIGQAETFAETLEQQLVALQTGLFIRSALPSLASEPDGGTKAAGDDEISITITIDFGLE